MSNTDFDSIRASLTAERDQHRASAAAHTKHANAIDATLRALTAAIASTPGQSGAKPKRSNLLSGLAGAGANGKDVTAHHINGSGHAS